MYPPVLFSVVIHFINIYISVWAGLDWFPREAFANGQVHWWELWEALM